MCGQQSSGDETPSSAAASLKLTSVLARDGHTFAGQCIPQLVHDCHVYTLNTFNTQPELSQGGLGQ